MSRESERDDENTEVVIGSKWGYRYTADWRVDTGGEPHEVKDHSLSHLDSQLKETHALLGGHLNLYQIHSATLDSGVLDDAAVLDRLRQLKAETGWRVGLSLSGVKQSPTLSKALETGVFDSVQATWNLLEQSAGVALQQAHDAGMKVIIKEGMANGRLLQKPVLLSAAQAMNVPPDALALAAVVAQPFEPMVLSGAVTAPQIQSNVQASVLAKRLLQEDKSVLEEVTKELRTEPAEYWTERSQLAWS